MDRMRVSLTGLAVGDAFGCMLDTREPRQRVKRLIAMQRPWRWSDDTAMAIAICDELAAHGTIDGDRLAHAFAERYARDPERGYGAGAATILGKIAAGGDWRAEASAVFGGKGSYGNGAAMRAAPIGARFAPDLARVREEALRSAAPTHAHPDGAAGAVAVAIAAALACEQRLDLAQVAEHTPPSPTRERLLRACQLGLDFDVQLAGEELGTGTNISSRDTVPFALWVAARHTASYEEALWTVAAYPALDFMSAVVASLDRDTLAAITGGVVACAVGLEGIPVLWREATEMF
jgi:ADP-ribosylglycohydrolase